MLTPHDALLHQNGRWIIYRAPRRVIQTRQLAEILPLLAEIENEVEQNGLHAVGFLAYEAAPAFDPAMRTHPPVRGLPLLWFGLYTEGREIELPAPAGPSPKIAWQPSVERAAYHAAIAQIKNHIAHGDTYQVNYTLRLRASLPGDPWQAFLRLAAAQPAPYAAALHLGSHFIASASPELFFHLSGDTITARPMKGTAPRAPSAAADQAQAEWLRNSVKNRAENVMIVDMLRNDLGRIAETGSVRVPALFTTERYPSLWQMTSTVQARTRARLAEIFTSIFPCASITGAPKIRAMHIIAALETSPRGLYTGAIGILSPGRQAQFNVAIRTLISETTHGQAEYGVGGGIVWDSTPQDEYAEALLKARALTAPPRPAFDLLETLRWQPSAGYHLLERHLARLAESADYFGINYAESALRAALTSQAESWLDPMRVRIILPPRGIPSISATPLPAEAAHAPVRACLSPAPIHSQNVFLHHKTTRREIYASALAACPGFDDVLLHNERGELTEFTIGNLAAELDGELVTPPLSSGLLAGCERAEMLAQGRLREHPLTLADLPRLGRLYRLNSVRGLQPVRLEPGTPFKAYGLANNSSPGLLYE